MDELADGHVPFRQHLETARRLEANNIAGMESYRLMLEDLRMGFDDLAVEIAKVQNDSAVGDGLAVADSSGDMEESLKKLGSYNDILETELERVMKERDGTIVALKENTELYRNRVVFLQNALKEKDDVIKTQTKQLASLENAANRRKACCAHRCVDVGVTAALALPCPQQQQHREKELVALRTELAVADAQYHELRLKYDESRRQERLMQNDCKKLSQELALSKNAQKELRDQLVKVKSLLGDQEDKLVEQINKCQEISKTSQNQSKQLQDANANLRILQNKFRELEKRRSTEDFEKLELRSELQTVKENCAALLGKKNVFAFKVQELEGHIQKLNRTIKEERTINSANKTQAEKKIDELQASLTALKRDFRQLQKKHKDLEDDYQNLEQSNKESNETIVSFRKLKKVQAESDIEKRETIEQYNQHIKLLLHEREEFLEDYRKMHRDFCTLQTELDRLKMCQTTRPPRIMRNIDYAIQGSSIIQHQIEHIRRSSELIRETRDAMQDRLQPESRQANASTHTTGNKNTTGTNTTATSSSGTNTT